MTIKSILKTEINRKMKHIKNAGSQSNQNCKTRFAKTTDNFFSSNFLTQQIFSNYSTLSQTQINTETNPSHYKGKVARMEVRSFLLVSLVTLLNLTGHQQTDCRGVGFAREGATGPQIAKTAVGEHTFF